VKAASVDFYKELPAPDVRVTITARGGSREHSASQDPSHSSGSGGDMSFKQLIFELAKS
jgi:hypothetical protein